MKSKFCPLRMLPIIPTGDFPQFSRLPVEIQLLIGHIAIKNDRIFPNLSVADCYGHAFINYYRLHYGGEDHLRSGIWSPKHLWQCWSETALLFTCRTFYYELRSIFYSINIFRITKPRINNFKFPSFQQHKQIVRSIHINGSLLPDITEIAPHFPNLENLKIDLSQHHGRVGPNKACFWDEKTLSNVFAGLIRESLFPKLKAIQVEWLNKPRWNLHSGLHMEKAIVIIAHYNKVLRQNREKRREDAKLAEFERLHLSG